MPSVLETKFIRQNVELVEASLRKRGQAYDLQDFQNCDAKRRAILLEAEEIGRASCRERV